MSNNRPAQEKIFSVARESSRSRLAHLAHRNDVEIREVAERTLVYSHWMALILLAGKDLRLTFKAHFMSVHARQLASGPFKISPSEITEARAKDFFKEYCNLTAGHMKLVLAANEIKAGVSLPALARGFDEVYYPRSPTVSFDVWQLVSGNELVICSADVEFFEPVQIQTLSLPEDNNVGEVDFL